MAKLKSHKPGEFCWTDLGAKDTTKAKRFYRGLFGWTVKDYPMGMDDAKYSMLRVRGKDACALYPMVPEQRRMKAPPSWLPYVLVRSVDAFARKAKAAGGKIVSKATDVTDWGRMAVIQDPTGATFALWQARASRGAGPTDAVGTVCWHDLNTPRPAVAARFYTKLFGWKKVDQEFDKGSYHLFQLGKNNVGGMWPEPMKRLPPSWLTYWQVADCAKSVAKAKRLGGRVLMNTMLVPKMLRFAVLADPQGAVFGLLEPL